MNVFLAIRIISVLLDGMNLLVFETVGLFLASALGGLWVSLRGSHCCNQKEGKTALQG